MIDSDYVSDFFQGQIDCRDGKPHQDGMSEAYDRGYSTQYQLEQINEYNSVQLRPGCGY